MGEGRRWAEGAHGPSWGSLSGGQRTRGQWGQRGPPQGTAASKARASVETPGVPARTGGQVVGVWDPQSWLSSLSAPSVAGRGTRSRARNWSPNTRKWIVRGDTCADKTRDFIGKGRPGRGQRVSSGTQENCSVTWLAVLGFMVMGLVSGLSLANHSDSELFLVVHALFSQDWCQRGGFW